VSASAVGDRGSGVWRARDAHALRELTARLQALYDLPRDPREQVERAMRAGFDSWTGHRPVAYRRINESR
jgi:hypothetical protein